MGRFSGMLHGAAPLALARKAIRRPATALAALARVGAGNWEALAFRRPGDFQAAQRELAESGLLDRLLSELTVAFEGIAGHTVRGKAVSAGGMRPFHAELLWALVRNRRPEVVVETGVCNGLSSAIILAAMERNGTGRLISVDLPEFSDGAADHGDMWEGKGGAVIPAGRPVGWLVDEASRTRWSLVLGKATEVLPPALSEAGPIDIFIHDSEHSYENQLFEFRQAYPVLKPGGLLVATDLNWSRAFEDFWATVRATGARRAFVDHSCALIAKP